MLKVTNENYCCTVLKVHHLIDLPGLDNLKGVSCFGQLALVSKEIQVGQLVLFFGPQTKLSDDFCSFNDLYRKVEQNKNGGTGFFDKNVVKPLKLRGNVSTSFVCPVTHLSYLGFDTNTLKEGDVFNEISGVEVCTKYVVRTNRERKAGQKQVKKDFRIDTKLMPEHVDTAHYLKHDRNIDDGQRIIVTQKLHSCVHESTIINTSVGDLTIKEIVDNKLNVLVKSMNVFNNKIEMSEIIEHHNQGFTDDWYEIETEDGQKLIITGNNPVWMPVLSCYRNAEDLTVGDFVLVD